MEIFDNLQSVKGIGPKKRLALEKLGLKDIYDFLTYYPRTYEDRNKLKKISELRAEEKASVCGVIVNVLETRTVKGVHILRMMCSDGSGVLETIWFNQPFLKRSFICGKKIFLSGIIDYAYNSAKKIVMKQISSYELFESDVPVQLGIIPVYSLNESVSQKLIRKIGKQIFEGGINIPETVPDDIRDRYGLLRRHEAFLQIHYPESWELLEKAKKRLIFEELYIIQYGMLKIKKESAVNQNGIRHLMDGKLFEMVIKGLPYSLTDDQKMAWNDIKSDMEKRTPMRRMIQGDVGSGKTVLALLALVKTVENGYQGAFMAPTEILAVQHYENFKNMLRETGIRLCLLTGNITIKERNEIYDRILTHQVDIIIGTHALIQEKLKYAGLGLVVTDEQHRFGISQRAALEGKGRLMPDVLVMTATPIPRTMTLTVYGDLNVSFIHQLPPHRQPVKTFVRGKNRRGLVYSFLKKEVLSGRQAYVVCPLIRQSDSFSYASVEAVYAELSKTIFAGLCCGLLHGKLSSQEKENIMTGFYEGKIQILFTTTVVEVGVDVPNATVMVIEDAERFGLAQLHQLRGRIGRGKYQSYCILLRNKDNSSGNGRLEVMEKVTDGFELAEEDLRLRGPGQFFGVLQHGIGDLKIADVLRDAGVLLQARKAAGEVLEREEMTDDILKCIDIQYNKRFFNILDT